MISPLLHIMRREPPLVVARVPGPGDDGPLRLRVRGLLLWSAFARGGLRRAAGGPLLRLHVTGIVGRRARGRRGGLPRVAQVPRVYLRADQVRLVGRPAARVPFSPIPRLVRGVPFHASVVVFELHPVFADGCQRNARMDAREAQIEVPSVFTATSVNALRKRARNARQRCSSISCNAAVHTPPR